MDFIQMTQPEYEQSMREATHLRFQRNLLDEWLTAVWGAFFLGIWFSLTTMTTLVLPVGIWLELVFGTSISLLGQFPLIAFVWFFPSSNISRRAAPFFYKWYFEKNHKKFVSQVNRLTEQQMERLLAEYPERKRIETYYDRKMNKLSPFAIYKTEGFLFVPGLFLVAREELGEILIDSVMHTSSTGHSSRTRRTEVRFLSKELRRTRSSDPEIPEYKLPMRYNREASPETGQQIMAWFWQCDPNGPNLADRVSKHMDSASQQRRENEKRALAIERGKGEGLPAAAKRRLKTISVALNVIWIVAVIPVTILSFLAVITWISRGRATLPTDGAIDSGLLSQFLIIAYPAPIYVIICVVVSYLRRKREKFAASITVQVIPILFVGALLVFFIWMPPATGSNISSPDIGNTVMETATEISAEEFQSATDDDPLARPEPEPDLIVYEIGETAAYEHIEVTVTGFEFRDILELEGINQLRYTPGEGNKYALVCLTITNSGNDSRQILPPRFAEPDEMIYTATISHENGSIYEPLHFFIRGDLFGETIRAGEIAEGHLIFEIEVEDAEAGEMLFMLADTATGVSVAHRVR